MHLEEAFIQSDLHCITFKVYLFFSSFKLIYFLEKSYYHEKFKKAEIKTNFIPLKVLLLHF